eukprot:COSAG01_NODE_8946_length_2607_cov_1.784290_2_plen_44_part_01
MQCFVAVFVRRLPRYGSTYRIRYMSCMQCSASSFQDQCMFFTQR